MDELQTYQIQLFKSVFKGRDDVFAVRWENGKKSGYMPAYTYDPYLYRAHKMRGGTFQNYPDKTYLPLSDKEISKHLKGEQLIGIYPLLIDNTSWFIVADFDDDNWLEECKIFLNVCIKIEIPAYFERSRSGQGGHIWIFFEQPYPAIRSRKIILSLLQKSGIFSVFDKSSSFDRLFPNQDFLSGKGVGNLIALPLYKKSLEKGNSCFLDTTTFQPIQNQYDYLEKIQRVTIAKLDELYQSISTSINLASSDPFTTNSTNKVTISNKLTITLNNVIRINRTGLSTSLINFLNDELNFANSEYFIKKKAGKNTFKTERYFNFVEEIENEVIVPRGFIGKLIRFCNENNIDFNFIDTRKKLKNIDLEFNVQLREHQQYAIEIASKKDFGVIVAPPGSGKTIVGLKIISDRSQPVLIIVHRKQLVEQWMERIETFLGIPKHEIGKIGQGKSKVGNKITIATIQSLSKELNKTESGSFMNSFGTIIVDECHHIPAKTYRDTIAKLPTYYLYGLTATPFRKYNDGKIIFSHIGEIIVEIKPTDISSYKQATIIIRNTELDIPFNSKTDQFETLSKMLIHDSARNKLILADVFVELKLGKRVVIITERKDHIDTLNQYLKQSYETVTLTGDDSENSRSLKWNTLKDGNYQVLITTGQYFGEGYDLQNANSLFLVYPFAFEGKLIQYIGRVQRSEVTPTIYDYRDIKIDYLNKLFLKRNAYYRKIVKQASLFDEPIEDLSISENSQKIELKIKIPIEELDFRYGSVVFKYTIPEIKEPIEFEIENLQIRPEFEVLKPYFVKTLKTKFVSFDIFAEFVDGELISQLATSIDLQKINQEVIEGVRFKFITNSFLGRKNFADNSLMTVDDLVKNENVVPTLYNDGLNLLDDLLSRKNYKHSMQLRYLANRHERTILKIRFVLSPFAFVFLLAGENQFHFVLETLDSEEATYLWHFEKDRTQLKQQLKAIDEQLSIIRNKGRQTFLDGKTDNFSKILHDYTEVQKGFVIWKDILEERIN
ncbi:MAG: DEAD/DEAH box helicase family protein [Paludibacter sp.]|nr:DEAD/DEAH box helicase family protein [Paludibacter sp.]